MRDEHAFIALYRQHQRGLYRFVYHMTGNPHTAEEVVQESFVTLLRKSGMADERAYLFGIARNLVHRGWEETPALELSDEIPIAPAALDDLAQAEREEAVRTAVSQLPEGLPGSRAALRHGRDELRRSGAHFEVSSGHGAVPVESWEADVG